MTNETRPDIARPLPSTLPGDDSPPHLDRQIQGRIGDHLRALYDGMMQQPVPDRFHDLIARLEGGVNVAKSD